MSIRQLHLEPRWYALMLEILGKHVPRKMVWAYGSRATGRRVKRFSDLDLAVEGRLSATESFGLEEGFDESSLPIKVDVVQLGAITPEFRARIEKDFVLVQEGAEPVEGPSTFAQDEVQA